MPDFGEFDRSIGPLYPSKPSRRPERKKKPDFSPQRRQRRPSDDRPEDGSRPHIDDYA